MDTHNEERYAIILPQIPFPCTSITKVENPDQVITLLEGFEGLPLAPVSKPNYLIFPDVYDWKEQLRLSLLAADIGDVVVLGLESAYDRENVLQGHGKPVNITIVKTNTRTILVS